MEESVKVETASIAEKATLKRARVMQMIPKMMAAAPVIPVGTPIPSARGLLDPSALAMRGLELAQLIAYSLIARVEGRTALARI